MALMDTETYRGYTIELHTDEHPENPREAFEEASTLLCWHRGYRLGDAAASEEFPDNASFGEWLAERRRERKSKDAGVLLLPLYLYDHSGISIAVSPFSCPWDSGQVGWAYMTHEDIRHTFMVKRVTAAVRERAIALMRAEVAEYDAYLTGQVFAYAVVDGDDETVESCGGFYDDDTPLLRGPHENIALREAKGIVDGLVAEGRVAVPGDAAASERAAYLEMRAQYDGLEGAEREEAALLGIVA